MLWFGRAHAQPRQVGTCLPLRASLAVPCGGGAGLRADSAAPWWRAGTAGWAGAPPAASPRPRTKGTGKAGGQ